MSQTSVTVVDTDPTVLEIVTSGPQGPAGPQGPFYEPPRAVSILNPHAAENITLMYVRTPLTVSAIQAHVSGASPSITFSLRHAADRASAGTEVVTGGTVCANQTTGINVTTFNAPTIPANSWLWLTTSATSGVLSTFHLTVHF